MAFLCPMYMYCTYIYVSSAHGPSNNMIAMLRRDVVTSSLFRAYFALLRSLPTTSLKLLCVSVSY